jgi:branched-chain amino acid transport system permease protein
MNAGLLLQATLAGAASGTLYGLVGLGYALVYRVSGVLNFAQGDLAAAGVYVFLFVLGGGGAVALVGLSPWSLAAAMLVALAASVLVALVVERAAVAPFLARGSVVGWVAATVAAGLFLRALAGLAFQAESYTVPEILPIRALFGAATLALPGGGVLQLRAVLVLALGLILALGFDRWASGSRTGRAMQAATQDMDAARLCGLSPERLRLLAWALAGTLAVVAGLLVAPARPLTLQLGVVLGLKGTAAAVLGRMGSTGRTLVAGVGIGIAESLLTTLRLPGLALGPFPGLQDVGALLLLVAVLAAAPGLLNHALEEAE